MPISKLLFPIFANKPDLVYLDSASSAQKPAIVIDAIKRFYENDYSNAGRSACPLAEATTTSIEQVRDKVSKFIGAEDRSEIVFTKGATEAMNLLASSLDNHLKPGDEVVITDTEHHSNILPWYLLAKNKGIALRVFKVNEDGSFDLNKFREFLSPKTKLVSFSPMSNVLGTIVDVEAVSKIVKEHGALLALDLCQYIVHRQVSVSKWGADFACFSSHKIYGPTGVGIFYCKKTHHEMLVPYQLGGGTVSSVNLDKELVKLNAFPICFEAGTLPIAQIVGMGAAIDFIESIGYDTIAKHDQELMEYTLKELEKLKYVEILGHKNLIKRSSIVSFDIEKINAFDLSVLMGQAGVCLRAGTACADPLHQKLNLQRSFRISFGIYNDKTDIDKFILALKKVLKMLA